METLFSDDEAILVIETILAYGSPEIDSSSISADPYARIVSIARIASVVWEERYHIIVSVASKNLKQQRRSLRQRQLLSYAEQTVTLHIVLIVLSVSPNVSSGQLSHVYVFNRKPYCLQSASLTKHGKNPLNSGFKWTVFKSQKSEVDFIFTENLNVTCWRISE